MKLGISQMAVAFGVLVSVLACGRLDVRRDLASSANMTGYWRTVEELNPDTDDFFYEHVDEKGQVHGFYLVGDSCVGEVFQAQLSDKGVMQFDAEYSKKNFGHNRYSETWKKIGNEAILGIGHGETAITDDAGKPAVEHYSVELNLFRISKAEYGSELKRCVEVSQKAEAKLKGNAPVGGSDPVKTVL